MNTEQLHQLLVKRGFSLAARHWADVENEPDREWDLLWDLDHGTLYARDSSDPAQSFIWDPRSNDGNSVDDVGWQGRDMSQ